MRLRQLVFFSVFASLALLCMPAAMRGDDASTQPGGEQNLTSLSLEDLMNVQVTSVAKQPQKVADAAAAVAVITQQDIASSGLDSIPELLRLAPGLDVAQVDANSWAIGSRGFNQRFDRSLLVLVDGRTVYLPTSSGVYWDTVDYVLPDLDRMEVIRGPGGTLWGANAETGVINIDTKNAGETQGWLASAAGGSTDQFGQIRYGGQLSPDTYFRVYGKYRDLGDFRTDTGGEANDAWQSLLGGLRVDRVGQDGDQFTLEAQSLGARENHDVDQPTFTPPFVQTQSHVITTSDSYLLGRWTRTISDRSDFSLQMYYDYFQRDDELNDYNTHTVDLDFQDHFPLGTRQEVVWGGGARVQPEKSQTKTGLLEFSQEDETFVTENVFAQDDWTIISDRLHAIGGCKLENNSRTGVEYEPTIRGLLTPDENNTVWAAVSRAVRTPSDFEREGHFAVATFPTATGVGESTLAGNSELESEQLYAYEMGYRVQPWQTVSLDVAAYYNDYQKLVANEEGTPYFDAADSPPRLVIPLVAQNDLSGEGHGVEVSAMWNPTPDWRLSGSYTFLKLSLHGGPGSDLDRVFYEDNSPHNQFQLHSYLKLTRTLELDASMYYVDKLVEGDIPMYVRVDVGLTWRPTDHLELSVGARNLQDDRHQELSSFDTGTDATEVPREFYGKVALSY